LGRQIDIEIAKILKKKKRYIIDVIPGNDSQRMGNTKTEQRSIAFKNVAFHLMLEHKIKIARQQQMMMNVQKKLK
jgi:hypothetical protein